MWMTASLCTTGTIRLVVFYAINFAFILKDKPLLLLWRGRVALAESWAARS